MRFPAAFLLLAAIPMVAHAGTPPVPEPKGAPPPAGASRASAAPAGNAPTPPVNSDALYDLGQQLFDEYAPPDVKAQYDFPSKQQWNAVAGRLQQALQGNSLGTLAEYAPQARAVLSTLRSLGVDPQLADWLEQRLDEAEVAGEIGATRRPLPAAPPAAPATPMAPPPGGAARGPAAVATRTTVPYYGVWLGRLRTRPPPADATRLMPVLRHAFAAAGVPPALAWVAEAESSLNPEARSPSGARGLFQLTPATARSLGLSTFWPDERTDPAKSARAAAQYLRELHHKFGTWPLALAAYNAGEGRVSRVLAEHHATHFAQIANALPAETRMYVPKVCALIKVRTGESIATL